MSQPPNTWGQPPAPRRRRAGLYITLTAAAAAAAFFGAGAIAQNINDDEPNADACKQAMQRDYDAIRLEIAAGGDPDSEHMPIECTGVDEETLTRYVGEIIDKEVSRGLEDAWSGATPTP